MRCGVRGNPEQTVVRDAGVDAAAAHHGAAGGRCHEALLTLKTVSTRTTPYCSASTARISLSNSESEISDELSGHQEASAGRKSEA